jgi:hypothetical protein
MRAMPHLRTVTLLFLVMAGLPSLTGGCTDSKAVAPAVTPSDVHLAAAGPALPAALPARAGDGGGRLEAVRAVALYCRLVDEGQYARAGTLCSRRRLWSRRALASLRGFRFRSARVYAAPDARTLVLKVRAHVRAGRGCPLPDGFATLFFTLGRVGSAVGGWLITAVSTNP